MRRGSSSTRGGTLLGRRSCRGRHQRILQLVAYIGAHSRKQVVNNRRTIGTGRRPKVQEKRPRRRFTRGSRKNREAKERPSILHLGHFSRRGRERRSGEGIMPVPGTTITLSWNRENTPHTNSWRRPGWSERASYWSLVTTRARTCSSSSACKPPRPRLEKKEQ